MAVAIRYMIQKEVFGAEERVLVIVSVTKPGRKKKPSFLVLSVNKPEGAVEISRVKSLERKELSKESYRRVKTWALSELRAVDGHSVDSLEFDLLFDKSSFKWIANNSADKNTFITQLYRAVDSSPGPKKTKFVNVDESKLKDVLSARDQSALAHLAGAGDMEQLQQDEWQEISPVEEQAIEALLGRDNAIQDAASFMEHLSEELSQLDQGNIHSLMGSEAQIQDLMARLEQGILEIERMEMKINVYDELLSSVREAMGKLGIQYSNILLQSNNLKALLDEVNQLVDALDLDPRVESILSSPQLHSPGDIRDCELAAESLQKSLQALGELPHGTEVLQAFNDQSKLFTELSSTFGHRLQSHITRLFTLNSSLLLENNAVKHTSGPSIASHSQSHADLLVFSGLMGWLKECEPLRFAEVMESYVRCFKPVYVEEIKSFFADSKAMFGRVGDHGRKPGFLGRAGSNLDMLSSLKPNNPLSSSLMVLSPNRGDRMSQSVADFSAGLSDNKPRFDQVFRTLLEQLQPVCVSEQKFLTSFFHFVKPSQSESMDEGQDEEDGLDDIDGSLLSSSPSHGPSSLLEQLFSNLLPELETFLNHGDKMDSYNSLHLLVAVTQRLLFALESGSTSFLDETLKKALICIKRLFDKLIVSKRRQIEDMKVPRGSKCGVLPCVLWLKDFADKAESIVMGTDRRAELDKAYQILVDAVYKTIERVSVEHQKTPPDVIKFENYRSVVDLLSRLKINSLEQKRDFAKKKYRTHKIDYVKNCLGRPLDKLSAFFEGVEGLIASGTKAEEVGYRLDYSRNELKKCIKEYPGKEVKRGLEKLYRRVEKEVSDSDHQVVWGAMQEAFIEQAQRFEALIARCYPGANINLEFTVDNLAEYFASISAQ